MYQNPVGSAKDGGGGGGSSGGDAPRSFAVGVCIHTRRRAPLWCEVRIHPHDLAMPLPFIIYILPDSKATTPPNSVINVIFIAFRNMCNPLITH